MKLAFPRLGVTGFPMAGHPAAKGGHEDGVYKRSAPEAEVGIAQFGATRAASPATAARKGRRDTSNLVRRLRP